MMPIEIFESSFNNGLLLDYLISVNACVVYEIAYCGGDEHGLHNRLEATGVHLGAFNLDDLIESVLIQRWISEGAKNSCHDSSLSQYSTSIAIQRSNLRRAARLARLARF
jgi:hypothetical protein